MGDRGHAGSTGVMVGAGGTCGSDGQAGGIHRMDWEAGRICRSNVGAGSWCLWEQLGQMQSTGAMGWQVASLGAISGAGSVHGVLLGFRGG